MTDTTARNAERRLVLVGVQVREVEKSLGMAWEAALMAIVDRDGWLLGAVNSEIQACIDRRTELALEMDALRKQLREEWEATRGDDCNHRDLAKAKHGICDDCGHDSREDI
jgi:hypothetical protein